MAKAIVRSDADVEEVLEWARDGAEDDPFAEGVAAMYEWLTGESDERPDEIEEEETEDEGDEGEG